MHASRLIVTGLIGLAFSAPAVASLSPRASASLSGGSGGANSQNTPAPTFGTFVASVSRTTPASSASATLSWTSSSCSMTGIASGASGAGVVTAVIAESTMVATYTFGSTMDVAISWNLSNVAPHFAPTGSVGWTISDASQNVVYGITYVSGGVSPAVEGGVPASSIGSGFTGQLAAGTWTIMTSVIVEGQASNDGSFAVSMNFTTVPGAGGPAMMVMASMASRRRRRG